MLKKFMSQEVVTYALVTGIALTLVVLIYGIGSFHLPDNQQGYQPMQPIAFSHHLHVGQLSIDCMYCHYGAESSRHAGIPPTNVCMNCHSVVTSTQGAFLAESKKAKEEKREPEKIISPELRKLYEAMGLDENLELDPSIRPKPIEWVKVHNLPDYVYFDHRAHVNVGVECKTCHGNIETMERVRQVETLSMGWCVNCHRQANRIGVKGKTVHASVDCTTCHY